MPCNGKSALLVELLPFGSHAIFKSPDGLREAGLDAAGGIKFDAILWPRCGQAMVVNVQQKRGSL